MVDESDKERITKLETNMAAVLLITDRRAPFETEVLTRLAVINSKMDDTKEYQKTCEAERKAHEVRLSSLENTNNNTNASRKTLMTLFGGIGGTTSLLISAMTLCILIMRHN